MLRFIVYAGVFMLAGCSTSSPPAIAPNGPADSRAAESLTQPTAQLSLNTPTTFPTTASAKLYTCPMHAQIVMDHPGKCPICGMTLEPKVGGK